MSCIPASKGPLSDTTLPAQISRAASYFLCEDDAAQSVRMAGRRKTKLPQTEQKHTRPLELLFWSYYLPLGSLQNSLVIKLLQSMLALSCLL